MKLKIVSALLLGVFLLLSSCSNDDENFKVVSHTDVTCTKTLAALRELNDSLLKSPKNLTRSVHYGRIIHADGIGAILGGIGAASYAWMSGPFGLHMIAGTIVLSSVVCSASAAMDNGIVSKPFLDSDELYKLSDKNYRTKTQIPDDTGVVSDGIINQISLPSTFTHLSYIGKNHNAILEDWRQAPVIDNRTRGGETGTWEPVNPIQVEELSDLYLNEDFRSEYFATQRKMLGIRQQYDYDFDNYLSINYPDNIGATYQLFLQATGSVTSTSAMISIVNQYITL